MKQLFICRHAKSSWDDPGLSDFDRPLNKRGLHDAPTMGQRLAGRGIHPDLICTSPALRAKTTAEAYAQALDYPCAAICYEPRQYNATPALLLMLLQEMTSSVETLLLVGHNPESTQLAHLLAETAIEHIPTCGVVALDLALPAWSQITPHCGSLAFIDFPKKKSI